MSRRAVSSATVPGQSGPVGDVPVEIAFDGTLYDRLGIDEEGNRMGDDLRIGGFSML